jgi:hypothetical protein
MIAPKSVYTRDPTQEVLVAVRELLGRNSRAAYFGVETISKLLYEKRYLPYRTAPHEVECTIEVLRIDGEVIG